MSTKPRAAAATLAVLAALTLTVTAPATAEAKVKGDPTIRIAKIKDVVGQPEALVAPGQPPTPCKPDRYKCPLGGGLL